MGVIPCISLVIMIIALIVEKIETGKTKSIDWKVEILEIKSKYKNDEISFEKARKMIKKIKRQKN